MAPWDLPIYRGTSRSALQEAERLPSTLVIRMAGKISRPTYALGVFRRTGNLPVLSSPEGDRCILDEKLDIQPRRGALRLCFNPRNVAPRLRQEVTP